MSADTDRWTEIRKIHIESADAYRILGGIVLVGLGIWIGSLIFAGDNGYGTNLYTELISIGVTVFILDFLNRRRDERRRIEDLKERLLRDIRSSENSVAKQAAHELREYGWLDRKTGLLQGANLNSANLQEANLWGAKMQGAHLLEANLQGADLEVASLQGADLSGANLQGAHLGSVKLQQAKLRRANLQEADLQEANLQGADLSGSNLEGAHLADANLEGANLKHTKFDEHTVLPNEICWQSDVEMTRFTNRNHPEFWRSDYEESPAYRGKDETSN